MTGSQSGSAASNAFIQRRGSDGRGRVVHRRVQEDMYAEEDESCRLDLPTRVLWRGKLLAEVSKPALEAVVTDALDLCQSSHEG